MAWTFGANLRLNCIQMRHVVPAMTKAGEIAADVRRASLDREAARQVTCR
jgi:hypothetical protein